jgi:hypothetical protein
MKNKLHSILLGIGLLVVIFSGCQKVGQLVPSSAFSIKDAEFTKWITNFPNMEGVVGGDVGVGTYAGEVLNMSTVGNITSIEALYHFNGSLHSFTAHVFVTENDAPGVGTAKITGNVTEGWLKGETVIGEYKVWGVCPIPTPGNAEGTQCYQGILHLIPEFGGH